MRSLYFDTSYLGKLRWPEPGTAEVTACAATADELVCSSLGRAEFYSISHRKLREGIATASTVRIVCSQFEADCASAAIRFLPLSDEVLDRVAHAFATASASTFLRAADAIHLATAAVHGFTEIHSNDRHLLAAAPLFGIRGVNVIP